MKEKDESRFISDEPETRGLEISNALNEYNKHVAEHDPSGIQFAVYLTGHKIEMNAEGKPERHVCTMIGGREDEVIAAILDMIHTMIQKRPESLPLFIAGAIDIMETVKRDIGEPVTNEDGKIVGTAIAIGPGAPNSDERLKKDTKSAGIVGDLLKRFFTTPGENDESDTKH